MEKKTDIAKQRRSASATQIIAFGFAVMTLVGTVLLMLPIASRSGVSAGFVDALFTSAAAACVTGMTVADTYMQWSPFGQAVIFVLMQVGGIGFMTAGTMISMAAGRKIGLRERIVLGEAISSDSMSGIVAFVKKIIICVIVTELIGAAILAVRFIPLFGIADGIYKAVFHSVSAFCNAGIDLMGEMEEFSSLTYFVHDPLVNFTIMALIIIGGLGFLVWEDIYYYFKEKDRLRLHTKLVLIISAVLTAGGFVLFLVFEYSNPSTIGDFNIWQKLQAALFYSVSARTAGFSTVSLSEMSGQSVLVMMLLMLVGGSPGSTAGGIKTTTVGILVIAAYSVVRGASKVNIFGRSISTAQIMRAMAIVILSVIILFAGVLVLLTAEDIGMKEALFETAAAFSTGGATLGVTPKLGTASRLILVILMYMGRVGILTAAMAITKRQYMYEEKITYPAEAILF